MVEYDFLITHLNEKYEAPDGYNIVARVKDEVHVQQCPRN